MRDFSNDLTEVRRRVDEASVYLKVEASRARIAELEIEVARPDLWDDQENAKKVNSEYSNLKSDLDEFASLAGSIEDLEVLHEMAREIDDESQEPDLERGISQARTKLDALELRSLFTGVHDEADAIVQINAKDGGVDAQDWSEMLLRMFTRWAERKGFDIEIGESKFMFVYNETNGGLTKIRLYNFSGTLLNSETTTWTNLDVSPDGKEIVFDV